MRVGVSVCVHVLASRCVPCCPAQPIYQQTSCLKTIITQIPDQQSLSTHGLNRRVWLGDHYTGSMCTYSRTPGNNPLLLQTNSRASCVSATDCAILSEQHSIIHRTMNSKQECGSGMIADTRVFYKSSSPWDRKHRVIKRKLLKSAGFALCLMRRSQATPNNLMLMFAVYIRYNPIFSRRLGVILLPL